MRVDLTKPRKAPTKFFEDFDYQLLILEDSDVDELIKLYSTHVETNGKSIKNTIQFKKLKNAYSSISCLASQCTDKNKEYYVEWALSNIKSNSNYSKELINHYSSFFGFLIKSKKIYDENNNLSDEAYNLQRTNFNWMGADDKYFDLIIVQSLFDDILDYEFVYYMLEIDFIIMHTNQFNTIYDILKFLNLDKKLNIPVKELLKLINSMHGEQFYNLVLQQLARRYDKEWFYSNMPNTFKTAKEARTAFEIMMNFKYDGNVSK